MSRHILEEFLEAHDGVLRVSEGLQLDVSAPTIYAFARDKGLKRISKGVYADPDGWHDEMWLASVRWPRVIFSHHSALMVHDLSDREPKSLSVTVPSGYTASSLSQHGLQVFYIKPSLHDLGKTKVMTPEGHAVPSYDLERTICDMLRSRSHFDQQIVRSAIRSYMQRDDKQLGILASYAAKLGVSRMLAQYMEVLL